MEEQIQYLQAEVERLQLIVRLLADRNRELERLLTGKGLPKQAVQTSMQTAGGALHDVQPPEPVLHRGMNEFHSSMHILDGAMNTMQLPVQNEHGAMYGLQTGEAKPDEAFASFTNPIVRTDGQKQPLPDLPVLMARLKKNGMAGVKDSGVERAARLLLWTAREAGPITYAEMQARFEMTSGGVAKMVASLLRRGWLRRSAYQCFALTDEGWRLLAEVNRSPQNDRPPTCGNPGACVPS